MTEQVPGMDRREQYGNTINPAIIYAVFRATSVLQVKASLAGHTLKGTSGGAMGKSDNAEMEDACSP